ncbi:MAG: hypothetical protein JWP75_3389 [Frondihabitans sp.]|nr:hypothetical protein [Frondihabitans sp.]
MRIRAPHLGIAPRVALVAGGALVAANLLLLVKPVGTLSAAFLASTLLMLVACLVLALGLLGERGAFGSRAVSVLLIVSGALGVAVVVVSPLGSVDPDVGPTLGYRAFSSVLLVADMARLFLLLMAAAVAGRSEGTQRDVRYGLRALALVALAGFAIDNILWSLLVTLIPASGLTALFAVIEWLHRLNFLAGIAVGVWFAWPWLGPRLISLRAVVTRAYRRYVDSTP